MTPAVDDVIRDLKCRRQDELRSILAGVAETREGEEALRQTAAELPPPPKGRVEGVLKLGEGFFLRQEFVPCGKANCRKDPDEHGPYWYSYRFVNGSWKQGYHGREKPDPQEFWTIEQAKKSLSELSGLGALDDSQVSTLRKIANVMAALSADPQAVSLREKAEMLLIDHEKRRRRTLRKRYNQLASKRDAGGQLTPQERAEFKRIVQVLAGEH